MTDQINPCDCGADISLTMFIQKIWIGARGKDIYIVCCDSCGEVTSFRASYDDMHIPGKLTELGINAWNDNQAAKNIESETTG